MPAAGMHWYEPSCLCVFVPPSMPVPADVPCASLTSGITSSRKLSLTSSSRAKLVSAPSCSHQPRLHFPPWTGHTDLRLSPLREAPSSARGLKMALSCLQHGNVGQSLPGGPWCQLEGFGLGGGRQLERK